MLPQYTVITASEVMFSVTGLGFAYSQAPTSLKSFLQACWQLTVASGNVIVVIIAEAKIFQSQANEFFLFAAMMIFVMVIFICLAKRYQYVIIRSDNETNEMNAMEVGGTQPPTSELQKQTFANSAFQED